MAEPARCFREPCLDFCIPQRSKRLKEVLEVRFNTGFVAQAVQTYAKYFAESQDHAWKPKLSRGFRRACAEFLRKPSRMARPCRDCDTGFEHAPPEKGVAFRYIWFTHSLRKETRNALVRARLHACMFSLRRPALLQLNIFSANLNTCAPKLLEET